MLTAARRAFQAGGLRYSLALALSAGAHLGLGLALAGGPLADSGSPAPAERHLGALTVYLQAHPAAAPQSAAAPSVRRARGPQPAAPERGTPPAAGAAPLAPAVGARPALAVAEPYYYSPAELSEKPLVAQDIGPDVLRDLPDQYPLPARVQLLINERGEVDKVVVEESYLSEQAERFVSEALEKLRFHPGRLGGAAVKSRLPIEVSLQSAAPSAAPSRF